MSNLTVSDRTITCPHCFSDNRLIGSYLSPSQIVSCSSCGVNIDTVSEMRINHVESKMGGQSAESAGHISPTA